MGAELDMYFDDKISAKKAIDEFFEENWERINNYRMSRNTRVQIILS
jgi:hypothetical protein